MTKQEAKKAIKQYGLYDFLHDYFLDDANAQEIVFRVLDNIDTKTLQKAINKATR